MTRYDDLSPRMRRFLGAFIAFRKLGFSADDVHFGVVPSVECGGGFGAYAVLKTGGREFWMFAGEASDPAAAKDEYRRVSLDFSSGEGIPESDYERVWQESECRVRSVEFVLAILRKGIRLPDCPRSDLAHVLLARAAVSEVN